MTDQNIAKSAVMDALRTVMEPELHQDLVTLNMIQNVQINDGAVDVTVMLTTPACPLKNVIQDDIQKAMANIDGVKNVDVHFSSNVKKDNKIADKLKIDVKNIIAIASGKGGVGKTTVAVNLALALNETGAKVGILDADIYGPNIPQMLGVHHLPQPVGNKIVPAKSYNLQIMSIGFLVKDDEPIIWRGPLLHKAIQDFFNDVLWDDLDYLIVDLPPGTGDVQISLAQSIPLTGGIIVSTPQDVALADAKRGLVAFQKFNVPVIGIIENMAYFIAPDTGNRYEIFGHGGAERAAEQFRVPFLGRLPLDPQAREGGDIGKPVVVEHPDSEIAHSFHDIAGSVAARLAVMNFSGIKKIQVSADLSK